LFSSGVESLKYTERDNQRVGNVELFYKIAVGVLVAAALYYAFQPRYHFMIRVHQGTAHLARGKVTADFVAETAKVCAEFHINRAWVGGVLRGKRMALAFSRSIPPPCRQRLRNLWLLHG
jgi:hypothetical protein